MSINKEDILLRTDRGLQVFQHYLHIPFRPGKNFRNPLYEDKKASCNIYLDVRKNIYRMKDFGNIEYSGDCFEIVGKIHNLNCKNPAEFIQILQQIDKDLNLFIIPGSDQATIRRARNIPPAPVLQEKVNRVFSCVEKSFSAAELAFFAQSGITREILNRYKTVSLQEYRSVNNDKKAYTIQSSDQEPMFGYKRNKNIKIYRPFSKIRFLYGGEINSYCFGLEQLPAKGDILFITGGEKDV
ncbi:MAG: bifunctional DNA primase/helicase, partial [Odoribacter sp.]|nr:bifunctional DNA primase/helicase [Odoribacter sp.]